MQQERERAASKRSDGLVKARVKRKYESETWELYRLLFLNVETYDTLEIKGTPEHPFRVVKPEGIDGKGRWIPIKNLEVGMRCIVRRHASSA